MRQSLTTRELGFRRVELSEQEVQALEHLVNETLGTSDKSQDDGGDTRFRYESGSVEENEDYYLTHLTWIGCSGVLIHKREQWAVPFGSYTSAARHVWAINKGLDLKTERNDLILTAIHNVAETTKLLENLIRGVDRTYTRSLLEDLPVRFENLNLYFSINDLYSAELHGHYEFLIEPASCDCV